MLAAAQLMEVFRTLSGRRFYGVLDDEDTDVMSVLPSRRTLRVPVNSPVVPGTLFYDHDRRIYLCADRNATRIYRIFRLFEMDRELPWVRRGTITDPVTGLEREAPPINMGTVWARLEPAGELSGAPLNVPESTFRVITGVELEVDDWLGEHVVTRADRLLGITIAEVR